MKSKENWRWMFRLCECKQQHVGDAGLNQQNALSGKPSLAIKRQAQPAYYVIRRGSISCNLLEWSAGTLLSTFSVSRLIQLLLNFPDNY